MKILIAILVFALSAVSSADDVQFKTIAQVRAAYTYHLTCATTSGEPQVNVTYHNGYSALAFSGGMAVIWPKEGLLVRDWPASGTYPSWVMTGTSNTLVITGNLLTTAEYVQLDLQDSTSGRFKTQFVYVNQGTGQQIHRELRCYANNYFPAL